MILYYDMAHAYPSHYSKQMMGWARMDDFAYRDVRDPTASRVRKILSALVNFYLFSRDHEHLIDSLEASYMADLAQKDQSADEVEEMVLKIAERQKQLVREAEEVDKIAGEIEKWRKKLIKLKEMEEPSFNRMESAKRRKAELQERTENLTMAVKQHDGEIARLRSRIVQSPDRVRQTIQDMATSLQSLKDELLELDRIASEHESRIAVARRYEAVGPVSVLTVSA